jgi:uncharacterized cupin superfamily protein
MLGGEQTGGTLAVILGNVPPGTGPPLHVHSRDDELFLVVEGTIRYFADDGWTDVGPGGVVYFPRGTPHRYRNAGTTPARQWILTTPSGFEHFLPRFNEEMARPGGPDRERIVALHAEYGYTLLDEAQRQAGGEA